MSVKQDIDAENVVTEDETTENEVTEEQVRSMLKNLVLRTEQLPDPEIKNNEVLKRVFQMLKDTDYDEKFFKIAAEHHKIMSIVNFRSVANGNMEQTLGFKNLQFLEREECLTYYTAKLFFDKMQLFKCETYPVNINYTGSIKALPLQYFLNPKENSNARAKLEFENNLKNGDLLFVEMVQTECKGLHPPEIAKLRIIAKVRSSFDIDQDFAYHLNCNVFMFKNLEMDRLGRNEIKSSEVLKVCVLGQSSPHKRFVTTNSAQLKLSPSEKISINLGIVSSENEPPFLKSFKMAKKSTCYSNYLRSHSHFYQSTNLTKDIESLGIDPFRIYSFCTTRDGLTAPPGRSTDSLVRNAKEAIHNDAQNHLENAKKLVQKAEFPLAIEEFENSAKCWPENFKVYESRGKMYLQMSTKRQRRGQLLLKALKDFEAALQLNPSAQESKQCLSLTFVYLSKRLVKNREYSKAMDFIRNALKIYPENKKATAMLKTIELRMKSRGYIVDEDAMDLQTLERKKELIKKKLKQEPLG